MCPLIILFWWSPFICFLQSVKTTTTTTTRLWKLFFPISFKLIITLYINYHVFSISFFFTPCVVVWSRKGKFKITVRRRRHVLYYTLKTRGGERVSSHFVKKKTYSSITGVLTHPVFYILSIVSFPIIIIISVPYIVCLWRVCKWCVPPWTFKKIGMKNKIEPCFYPWSFFLFFISFLYSSYALAQTDLSCNTFCAGRHCRGRNKHRKRLCQTRTLALP